MRFQYFFLKIQNLSKCFVSIVLKFLNLQHSNYHDDLQKKENRFSLQKIYFYNHFYQNGPNL